MDAERDDKAAATTVPKVTKKRGLKIFKKEQQAAQMLASAKR